MSAHPILSLRRPTELFQHLTTLGYQAECDAVDDMPVAHTEALSQLIRERIEALEVRGNGLLWQRVRIVEAMERGFEVLDDAANRVTGALADQTRVFSGYDRFPQCDGLSWIADVLFRR